MNVYHSEVFLRWCSILKKTYFVVTFFILILGAMTFLTPDLSRKDLESKYALPPSQFKLIKGLRVHYRDTGNITAPVLVMLHGFGSSLQTWDEWSNVLDINYRVIRLDLAGFGLTGASADENYSDEADVQRIEDFLNALELKDVTLIGHSMGGRIAWNYASAYPQRVRSLVLLAPDGFPAPGQNLGDRPYDAGPIAGLIQFVLPKFLVKKSLEPAFFNPRLITDELLDRYYDLLRAPQVRQAILARMRQTINSDPVNRLQKITAPTLLLWGEGDQMIPSRNSEDYLRVMRNAKVIKFPKASHLLHEETPKLALPSVLDFIESHKH